VCQLLQPTLVTSGAWVPGRDAPHLPPPSPCYLREQGWGGREKPLVVYTAVEVMNSVCSHVGTGSISQSLGMTFLSCNSHCLAPKRVYVQAATSEGRERCWGRDWEEGAMRRTNSV